MEQSSTAWYQTVAGAVLIILIGGGIFLYMRRGSQSPASDTTPPPEAASSTADGAPGMHTVSGVTGTGNFTVELAPTQLPPAPDFRAPIAFSADVTLDVRAAIQKNADVYIARIAKNAGDLQSWIDLATVHKMGGDYKTPETFWTYVTKAAPKNSVAFANLGDLYANFLHDYAKAEANYRVVISLDPSDTSPYTALFTLYSNVYKKGTSAAEDILKQGIKAAPQSVDLQVILARYYRSSGRTAEARAEYDAAIASARAQGQTSLATQIQEEKDTF